MSHESWRASRVASLATLKGKRAQISSQSQTAGAASDPLWMSNFAHRELY